MSQRIDYLNGDSEPVKIKIRNGVVCHITRLDVSIGKITFHKEFFDEQLIDIPSDISIMCGDGEILRFKESNKNFAPIAWFSDYYILLNGKKVVKIMHTRQHTVDFC
jgi:hypothetical protein